MTQEEKYTQLGRTITEIGDHEREIKHPLVKLRNVATRLRVLADTIEASYGGMLDGATFRAANVAGATITNGFEDVANVEAISKLENDVREHGRTLGRLYNDRSALT